MKENVASYIGEEMYSLGQVQVYISTQPRTCNLYRMKDGVEEFRLLEFFADYTSRITLILYRGGGKQLTVRGMSEEQLNNALTFLELHDKTEKHTLFVTGKDVSGYRIRLDWTTKY